MAPVAETPDEPALPEVAEDPDVPEDADVPDVPAVPLVTPENATSPISPV